MTSQDAGYIGDIDDLVSKICKDKLHRRQVKDNCLNFLTKVEIPSGWEDKSFKLDKDLITYKYRLQILKDFIETKEADGVCLTSASTTSFFDELKQFSLVSRDDYDNLLDSAFDQKSRPGIDLFEQNVKLEGVVVTVWKSGQRLRASVLVKKESHSKPAGSVTTSNFLLAELVVSLQDEGRSGEEFHLKVAVGDIVEITKCRRKDGEAWEPEVIMCYSLSDAEIQSYLNGLSNCVQSDRPTATAMEITRCRAAWNYILQLSKENYNTEMTKQVLQAVDKICSSAPMSHTVREIVQGFQKSEFFKTILPGFIDEIAEKSSGCFTLLQKILEHVIAVVPMSGLQVLPMATRLAHNLVKASDDLKMAQDNGKSAVDFLSSLSTIIASEVPGARKDLKVVPWKELPLIPDVEEIKQPRLKTNDLPVIRKEGKYESEEEYLNTYFRLLREECFHKLRKGISDFLVNERNCDAKDMRMYRISLRGATTCHEHSPTLMMISLEYELLDTQVSGDMELTNCFLYGNLLCISIDGAFQEPVWAVVDKHIADQSIVKITLCDKANAISEPEFIAKMQDFHNRGEKAFMAESQTFYLSYAPAMGVLQHRDTVPFKEFLVFPDPKCKESAGYIKKIKSPPDWGIIFQKDSLPERSAKDDCPEDYSLLKDFDDLRLRLGSSKSILDESQLLAVEMALRNKLVLIQGPPGTGKSFVGVRLVNLLLSMHVPEDHGPILVVTYKNHALDNFILGCVKKVSSPDVKIVRVGRLNDDADDMLRRCLLGEVGHYWPEKLYKQKRKLLGQIWALQPKVKEAFEKLRYSSSFTVDMFLKGAPIGLLRSLLVENPAQKIADEAKVDKLIKERPKTEAKLREMVEKALNAWLPRQELFNDYVGQRKINEKGSSGGSSSPGKGKGKRKDDQDHLENPSDFNDPSVEQKERLLALEEDIIDEEDKEIAKIEPEASEDSAAVPCLRTLACIDKSELKSFKNLLNVSRIWKLNDNEKVQLVYFLQSEFYAKARDEFLAVSKDYSQLHHQLKELRVQHDIDVMRKCHVIGMTVTGATLRANLLADIKPSVMIVEEAAEILEGQLVAVIPPSVQHLIMIGDHMQLKPVVHFVGLKKRHHLDLSMFERLMNCELPFTQLKYQCRMRDEFVDLLRELKIYKELKTNKELVKGNDKPRIVTSSMYFWTHTGWESNLPSSHSKRNSHEAREITKVAKTFCQEGGVLPTEITILCSYRGQVLEIKNQFQSEKFAALKDIEVTTIDSFQGRENDIILISLVRSNQLTQGKIGYLSSMNRLCVAISRARCGLYLFGNHTHFGEASRKGWKVVSEAMRRKGCLGRRFPFSLGEDSNPPRQVESQPDGSSPTRQTEAKQVTNITATTAYINIGGDSSANTINMSSVPPNVASLPARLNVRFPGSGKTPVQDPQSPAPGVGGYRPPALGVPTQEAGSETLEVDSLIKDARDPIQVVDKPTKDAGFPTPEAEPPTKEARESVQVSTPKSWAEEVEPPIAIGQDTDSPTVQVRLATEDAESVVQEVESPTKEARGPIQEVSPPKMGAGSPTQVATEGERPLGLGEIESLTERPIRVENVPQTGIEQLASEDGSTGSPVEESRESQGENNEFKVDPGTSPRHVFQEGDIKDLSKAKTTVEEGPFQEEELVSLKPEDFEEFEKEKPLQETEETDKGEEELSGGKPMQEIESPDVKGESSKEVSTPAQESMAAGKGPFEETGQEEGKALQETGRPGEPRAMLGDESYSGEGDSGIKGTESSKVDAGSSKEDALPTQESMAAGKGPFEETGLEVGVKGHPSDDKE